MSNIYKDIDLRELKKEIESSWLNKSKINNIDKNYIENKKKKIRLNHFPTLLINFFKKILFSLAKPWGVWLLLLTITFLYFTNSFPLLYHYTNMKIENYKVERTIKRLKEWKEYLINSSQKSNCHKWQIDRILSWKEIEKGYCNN